MYSKNIYFKVFVLFLGCLLPAVGFTVDYDFQPLGLSSAGDFVAYTEKWTYPETGYQSCRVSFFDVRANRAAFRPVTRDFNPDFDIPQKPACDEALSTAGFFLKKLGVPSSRKPYQPVFDTHTYDTRLIPQERVHIRWPGEKKLVIALTKRKSISLPDCRDKLRHIEMSTWFDGEKAQKILFEKEPPLERAILCPSDYRFEKIWYVPPYLVIFLQMTTHVLDTEGSEMLLISHELQGDLIKGSESRNGLSRH